MVCGPPGTDLALALAITHHIFDHDLRRGLLQGLGVELENLARYIVSRGYSPDWRKRLPVSRPMIYAS